MPDYDRKPVHPGRVLLEEFMEPLGLSQYRLAKDINVPIPRINAIVNEKRAVTPDTALRLSRYFGTPERYWMDLQVRLAESAMSPKDLIERLVKASEGNFLYLSLLLPAIVSGQ